MEMMTIRYGQDDHPITWLFHRDELEEDGREIKLPVFSDSVDRLIAEGTSSGPWHIG